MAKDPAFLFYTNDFSSGTQFFSDEQLGKYLRLLMAQHQHGHLTEKQVIFICKSYDNDIMSKFEKDEQGLYFNERLEFEIERRKKYAESRGSNKSGKNKPKENKIISKSYDNHMETVNENEIVNKKENKNEAEYEILINVPFEDFWDLYDKKVGSKEVIERKWGKLTDTERIKIMDYIPHYRNAQPDKQYRKNPETFLNGKGWNDEIINSKKIANGHTKKERPILTAALEVLRNASGNKPE